MPNPVNITNIPAPRVDFIDPRTGLMAREWYRFFFNLFNLTGGGTNDTSLADLQVGPPAVNDLLGELGITYDQAQIASMMAQYEQSICGLQNQLDTLPALPQLGTLSTYNEDNVRLIGFDTSPSPAVPNPAPTGTLYWDGNSTLGLQMNQDVLAKIGQAQFVYAKASSAITKGQLCKHTGAVGGSGVITAAPTNVGMTDAAQIVGVAAQDIPLNGFGFIQTAGDIKGFDTTGSSVGETWADGDPLYYNPAYVGAFTKNKPSAPNLKSYIGEVINAGSGGSGSINIHLVYGSTLGGTDSNVQFGTVADKDLIQYDSAAGYWKNVSPSVIPIGTATNLGGGTAGSLPYQSGVSTTTFLSIGSSGTVLTSSGTAPQWTNSTGTGDIVRATSPTLVTPALGVPTSGDFSTGTFTWPTFNQNTTGSAGSVANALTFNNSGTGAASGTTFNGSAARTISYNTIGAQPAGAYVTAVTGTAPVVSSGGTTPAISMAAATGSVNGYLTSTDWTTFNGKQAALVSGTNIKTVSGVSLLGAGDLGIIGATYGGTGVNNGTRTLTVNTNSGTLSFTNASTTLTIANTGSISGTNTGDQTITLTGDVTGSGTGSFATTLATVTAAKGGTGQTTYAVGDLLYASATNALSRLADVATGNALISGGVGVAPLWGKIGLTTHVSGTLGVGNGGTGTATAFTAGSVVFAGASGVYTQDNTNLFWDNTNKRLGVGVATPSYSIQSDSTIGAVGTGNARLEPTGDIWATRSGGTTGVIYLNSAGNRYLYFDGTRYVMPNSELQIPGVETAGAGSTATGGGQLYLNGVTSNRIDFNTNGVAAPAFTTRSAGTKICLSPLIAATTVDYAIGIETDHIWHSVPTSVSTRGFKWYGGTTQAAKLSSDGRLNVSQALEIAGSAIGGEAIYANGDINCTGYVFGNYVQATTGLSVGYSGTSPNAMEITGSFSRGAPVTKTGNFTLASTENWVICNGTATITVTLPAASTCTGREVTFHNTTAFALNSATANVIPLLGGAAGTAILAATDGAWATLVSNGTSWVIMQA